MQVNECVTGRIKTLKGRREFTRAEMNEIRRLIAEKVGSNRDRQKIIRDRMRERGFHIRDWTDSRDQFTVSDLDELIASGRITIKKEPMVFGGDIDLSILYEDPEHSDR